MLFSVSLVGVAVAVAVTIINHGPNIGLLLGLPSMSSFYTSVYVFSCVLKDDCGLRRFVFLKLLCSKTVPFLNDFVFRRLRFQLLNRY